MAVLKELDKKNKKINTTEYFVRRVSSAHTSNYLQNEEALGCRKSVLKKTT
jgi:hypothetical protein